MSSSDQGAVGRARDCSAVPELSASTTFGDTRDAALSAADEMILGIIESMQANGETIPAPFDDPIRVDQAS